MSANHQNSPRKPERLKRDDPYEITEDNRTTSNNLGAFLGAEELANAGLGREVTLARTAHDASKDPWYFTHI